MDICLTRVHRTLLRCIEHQTSENLHLVDEILTTLYAHEEELHLVLLNLQRNHSTEVESLRRFVSKFALLIIQWETKLNELDGQTILDAPRRRGRPRKFINVELVWSA